MVGRGEEKDGRPGGPHAGGERQQTRSPPRRSKTRSSFLPLHIRDDFLHRVANAWVGISGGISLVEQFGEFGRNVRLGGCGRELLRHRRRSARHASAASVIHQAASISFRARITRTRTSAHARSSGAMLEKAHKKPYRRVRGAGHLCQPELKLHGSELKLWHRSSRPVNATRDFPRSLVSGGR